MPTDAQIIAAGTAAAPVEYEVPNAQEVVLLAVNANVDGSATASAFVPTVEIVSDAGIVVARATATTTIAAGGSAEASWFPLRGGAGGSSATAGGLTWLWAWRSNQFPTDTDQNFPNSTARSFEYYHVRSNDTNRDTFLPVESWATPPPTANVPWGGNGSKLTAVQLLKAGKYSALAVVRFPDIVWAPYSISVQLRNASSTDPQVDQRAVHETNYQSDAWPSVSASFVTDPTAANEPSYAQVQLSQSSGGALSFNTGGVSISSLYLAYEGDSGATANVSSW